MNLKHILIFLCLFSVKSIVGQKPSPPSIINASIDSMGTIQWQASYYDGMSIEATSLNTGKSFGGTSSIIAPAGVPVFATHTGSFNVKLHKGINKFKITITDIHNQSTSQQISINSTFSNDGPGLWIHQNKIRLDEKVPYEIINQTTAKSIKGNANVIDIIQLEKGAYWLYLPKSTQTFTVK